MCVFIIQHSVPAIALFLNAENPLQESLKTNGTGPKKLYYIFPFPYQF
jgi:hypothetical protein